MPSRKCTPATSVSTVIAVRPPVSSTAASSPTPITTDASRTARLKYRSMMSNSPRIGCCRCYGPLKVVGIANVARALVEHGVDETEAVRRAGALRERDGFIDDDLRRHVGAYSELHEAEPEYRAADGVELLERAHGVARDELVEHLGIVEHGAQQLAKIEAVRFLKLGL